MLERMHLLRTKEENTADTTTPTRVLPSSGPRAGGFVGSALGSSNASLDLQLKQQKEEIEKLNKDKVELEEAMSSKSWVTYIDPNVVRTSIYADRHSKAFEDAAFEELCELIVESGGNTEAVKVRPIDDPDGKFQYELASGHRRHQATLRKNLKLKAEVISTMSEVDLVKQMHRENMGREALSPYERGIQWSRLIKMGVFSNIRQLASELGTSKTVVGRLIRYAAIPQEIIDAFQDPRSIRREWVDPLIKSYEADPEGMKLRCAEASSSDQPMKTYRRLLNINNETSLIVDERGVFARIRKIHGCPAIVLPRDTSAEMTAEIAEVIKKYAEGKRAGS